jgi:IS5 family transposase
MEEEYAAGFAINTVQSVTDHYSVMQIQETPYLQYLVGMQGYRDEAPFDPSMMTHFRKRISFEMISKVNEKIIAEERKKKLKMIRKLKKKKILR